MKLVGIMPVRNEGWILSLSVPALLEWVDELVILDHASFDGAVGGFGERVHVLHENDQTWFEMSHRQRLLEKARELDATHIAIVDADEALSACCAHSIRTGIKDLKPGEVLQPAWTHLWRGVDKYRIDGRWAAQRASMAFRDAPDLCWHTRDGYDHHHREPFNATGFRFGGGRLLHFQHASWRRLLAKQCWYKMTERVRWPNREMAASVDQKYHKTVDEVGIQRAPVPLQWVDGYDLSQVDLTAAPWQEAACREMLAAYGEEPFIGIHRYGVC